MCGKEQERDELRARFTKWMEVTVYRARLNYLKEQSRRVDTVPLEEAPMDKLSCQDMPTGESFDFAEEHLAEAFAQLPAAKKRIITMLFLLDMLPEEIAGELGCTVQYVYKQKSLAIKRLREALEGGDAH
ncbi:sigma-70 family RNA polymerase sigma factor [Acutalibacter muris]|uniref:Sigma-70 family RNA polymerase sigma factor n=1 Tax=Acutalibacter muris TaxID=1796620 RepID=A0A1Z2XPD4_9FIRM|nr:sigma-70 family RNA polymerase sigma factor [Acutalibacter muris]ANU53012.1 hypothetical protein A4V00_02670 [Hungateiclostridiaceae bacterium KB18]ASB40312.1 sigma-70 family RNA polymerase sigma factor [Acutalibacter muris]QQR29603.1 sigma-70 family RNA polymerase sigma factor [Acutalibacter muris]